VLQRGGEQADYGWWRFRDSNPGPADYDSVALINGAKSLGVVFVEYSGVTLKVQILSALLDAEAASETEFGSKSWWRIGWLK